MPKDPSKSAESAAKPKPKAKAEAKARPKAAKAQAGGKPPNTKAEKAVVMPPNGAAHGVLAQPTLSRNSPLLPITKLSEAPVPVFFKSPNSLFDDGYDVVAEKNYLRDLYDADDPNESDPRYPRLIVLFEREEQLRRLVANRQQRNHADPVVTDHEATGLNRVGKLVSSTEDTMLLHTKDAYRLFMGREHDGSAHPGAVAGKRCAAAFRAIWLLSGNDNPYADWILLEMTKLVDEGRSKIATRLKSQEGVLEKLKSRGLNYSILKSEKPIDVSLGFQSPYGFMIAELIADFDYLARVVKTLEAKDKLTRKESVQMLHDMKRPIRKIFESILPFQRVLQREQIVPLSRRDWASSDPESKRRIQFAGECFGVLPREVFTGETLPRHTKRKIMIDPKEMAFLAKVSLTDGMSMPGAHEMPAAGLMAQQNAVEHAAPLL